MKKGIIISIVFALALSIGIMVGCGGNIGNGADQANGVGMGQGKQQNQNRFDGSCYVDTGDGTFCLVTQDGTSENGYIPRLVVSKGTSMLQISCNAKGMKNCSCMVYIDGIEYGEVTTGDNAQCTITLTDDALMPGVHTVEVVKTKAKGVEVYKTAQYEVVV